MTKYELLQALVELRKNDDTEMRHIDADELILKFINSPQISSAYEALEPFWYA